MELTTAGWAVSIDAAARATQMIARPTWRLLQLDDRQNRATCRATAALAAGCRMRGEQLGFEDSRHGRLLSDGTDATAPTTLTRSVNEGVGSFRPRSRCGLVWVRQLLPLTLLGLLLRETASRQSDLTRLVVVTGDDQHRQLVLSLLQLDHAGKGGNDRELRVLAPLLRLVECP